MDAVEAGQAREIAPHIEKEVKHDSVMSPRPADKGEANAPRKVRIVIYVLLALGVQCFMSYDGGATPASLDAIQAEMNNSWSEFDIGVLGAVDKIGMTVTSLIWGRVLQRCNAKVMLVSGLLVNAAATFVFGFLRNKIVMYCTKFFMGATQSLQGVWGIVWTVNMAPPELLTMWLGLGGVAAGMGNGVGTAVAGFSTANGMPYSFAFILQAGVLGALWIALVLMPPRWLRITTKDEPAKAADTIERDKGLRTKEQLSYLMRNAVYVNTSLQISLVMFQASGIQYLFVRFFVSVWKLNKSWVTTMFLVLSAGGGGIGIALGPVYIDKMGGYQSTCARARAIRSLEVFNLVAVIFACVGIFCLVFRVRESNGGTQNTWGDWGDIWLWLLWLCIFMIQMAHQGSVPALCGINMQLPENVQSVASGAEMTLRNILGYAFGPLLPAVFVSFLAYNWSWSANPTLEQSNKLMCYAMGFVLAMNWCGVIILRRAAWAASRIARIRQRSAMNQLQDAFQSQDAELLYKALDNARAEELYTVPGGAAVIAAASGFLHAVPGGTGSESQASFKTGAHDVQDALADAMTEDELRNRIQELEQKVHPLEAQNAKLMEENRQLREQLRATKTTL